MELDAAQLAGASRHTRRGLRLGRRGGVIRLPKQRIQLAIAQSWRCHWCHQTCCEAVGWMNTATVEHVQPQSLGGPSEPWNTVMSCHRCNVLRDTSPWEDFALRASKLAADTRTVGEAKLANLRAKRRRRRERTWRAKQPGRLERWMWTIGIWARAVPI